MSGAIALANGAMHRGHALRCSAKERVALPVRTLLFVSAVTPPTHILRYAKQPTIYHIPPTLSLHVSNAPECWILSVPSRRTVMPTCCARAFLGRRRGLAVLLSELSHA